MQTHTSESGQQEQQDVVRPRKDEARAGPWVENQASGSHLPGMSFPVAVADEGTQVDDEESQKLVSKDSF